jgi:hypothetical protein
LTGLFFFAGNDPDSDGEVKAPTRQVVKQVQTTKKKDVAPETPATVQKTGGRNNRKYQGNEAGRFFPQLWTGFSGGNYGFNRSKLSFGIYECFG